MPAFSVGEDPWIRVRTRSDVPSEAIQKIIPGAIPGHIYTTGLRKLLLAAHLIDDLAIPEPPVESMVRRLLTALTARVTGLATPEDWEKRRNSALGEGQLEPGAVNAYFDRYAEQLKLTGTERPWLQDPRLEDECGAPPWAARIDMTRPSGNNAYWARCIPPEQPVPAAEAAAWLLTWHGYAPAGLASNREHGGRKAGACKAAPYRGYLSVFPHVPGNLLTTLLVSIPAPEYWPTGEGEDQAPWENPELPNPLSPDAPSGVVSLLTARTSYGVLLQPDAYGDIAKAWNAWGTVDELPEATDPYLIMRDESGPVRSGLDSSVWREVPSFLRASVLRNKINTHRPTALSTAASLPGEIRSLTGVRLLIWEQERQDRNRGWIAQNIPGIMAFCEESNPDAADRAERAVRGSSACAGALGKALAGAWSEVNPMRRGGERQALLQPAIAEYHRVADLHVWRMIQDPEYRAPWKKLAAETFDRFARTMVFNPHHAAVVAKARAGMNKVKEKNE